jgi:chemotaxis protein methyltransferase CheR
LSVIPEIKNMVTFAHHNLVTEDFMGQHFNRYDMDLILCNNVLIYFSPTQIANTVGQLVNSLREGGWLSVAAIEVPFINHPWLSIRRFPGVVFFERTNNHAVVEAKKIDTPVQAKAKTQPQQAQLIKQPQVIKNCTKEALLLVRTLANQGNIVQASEWCDAILAVEKLDPLVHHLHAEILLALGQLPEAVKSAKRAIFLSPDFAAAHYFLGILEEKQGHSVAAKRHFKTTLKLVEGCSPDTVLPGTDELTVARVKDHLTTTLGIQ